MTPGETKPAENRDWVDFAKGVAIVLVVLYHSVQFLTDVHLSGGVERLRTLLYFMPMPVFFFVAGLTARRMLTWSFRDLWRRRLLTLVYLYFLWSAIRVIFYLVVPQLRDVQASPTDLLTIALLPIWPTSSYWFLWALVLFALLAWLLRKVPPAVQVVAAGLLAVAGTTPGLLNAGNVGWDRVVENLVFYLIAIYIPHATYRFAARARIWHALVLAVAYVAIAIVIGPLHASRIPGLILLESAIAVTLTIVASVLLVRVRWLNFVTHLGQRSFPIYLLHLFVVALVLWLIAPLSDYSVLLRISILLPFALAIAALVASVYLFKFLRRFSWLWVSPFSTRRTKKTGVKPGSPQAVSPAEAPALLPSVEAQPEKPSTLDRP